MHDGVNDWGGMPYITHPISVMLMLPSDRPEDDRHMALLHDVIEDAHDRLKTYFSISDDNLESVLVALSNFGYSDYVVYGLKSLSRNFWPNLTYIEYVRNIVARNNIGSIWIKYCDNMDHTDEHRRARLSPEMLAKSLEMAPRYERSKSILRKALFIDS